MQMLGMYKPSNVNVNVSRSFNTRNNRQETNILVKCKVCNRGLSDSANYSNNLGCLKCIFSLFEKNKIIDNLTFDDGTDMPERDRSAIGEFIGLYLENNNLLYQSRIRGKECFGKKTLCPISNSDLSYIQEHEYSAIQFMKIMLSPIFNRAEEPINRMCDACSNSVKKIANRIHKSFHETQIFKRYLEIAKNRAFSIESFLKLFDGPTKNNTHSTSYEFATSLPENQLLSIHSFGPARMYTSQYYNIKGFEEKYFQIKLNCPPTLFEQISLLKSDIFSILDEQDYNLNLTIGALIQKTQARTLSILESYSLMANDEDIEKLSFFLSLDYIGFKKLFPFLVDPHIEEIFLDSPTGMLYVNHQKFGRCRTNLTFTQSELNAIKTHVRLASKQRLDQMHPGISYVINNQFFNCRFSIDIGPIQVDGFCLDIRKMNKSIFTIGSLIGLNSFSPEMGAFLYFCLRRRINITVVGETDSGKTTLLNAIDLLAPKRLRKIYVEEQVESLPQEKWGLHQLKYVVDPEDPNASRSKSDEIRRLLHRSPDLVYLGELLDEEETKAFFHCLSAGLRGLQTTHARDVDSIINRWLIHFKIPPVLLNDLGLIVSMKKMNWGRILTEVCELKYDLNAKKVIKENIFEYRIRDGKWINNIDISDTETVEKICKYDPMPVIEMKRELSFYEKIFEFWSNHPEYTITQQIDFLHDVDSEINKINPSYTIKDYANIWDFVEKKILAMNLEDVRNE